MCNAQRSRKPDRAACAQLTGVLLLDTAAMTRPRIVCISDTHGHHSFPVPGGESDILVHAGDFSMLGELQEVEEFLAWFQQQPHRLKIVIAGNHDVTFQEEYYEDHWNW